MTENIHLGGLPRWPQSGQTLTLICMMTVFNQWSAIF